MPRRLMVAFINLLGSRGLSMARAMARADRWSSINDRYDIQVSRTNVTEAAPGEDTAFPTGAGVDAGRGWTPLRTHVAVIGGLLLLSLFAWSKVWLFANPLSTITCPCGDPSQELWLFAWVPHALAHGVNPLFTSQLEAGQGGVNVMWDANHLLLALVLSPFTALFGPIASFNLAALLGPVVSGWCFFLASRKVSKFFPGQVVGTVLYAFSPFVIWNSPYGHVNLTWLFFPPLAFMLIYDLCFVPRRSAATIGRWFGLLVVAQFFSGTEILAIFGIAMVVCMVFALVLASRATFSMWRRFATAGAWAIGVSGCLLAYPLIFAMTGPRHIAGLPWSSTITQAESVPPSTILNAGAPHSTTGVSKVLGNLGAAGPPVGFLGIALIAGLVLSAFVWFRERLAWLLAGLVAFSVLVSFGPTLTRLGRYQAVVSAGRSPWWLPGRWLAQVPVVQDILPSRFAALTIFAVALLLVISADRWWQRHGPVSGWLRRHFGPRFGIDKTGWAVAVSVATAIVVLPVAATYTLPYVAQPYRTPAWFVQDTARLPTDSRVLVLPADFTTITSAMSWQAATGLHFDLEGGYAVTPDHSRSFLYPLPTSGAGSVLDAVAMRGAKPPTAQQAALVKEALAKWGVDVVIVVDKGGDSASSLALMTAVLDRAPRHVQGSWIWSGLGRPRAAKTGDASLARAER
jgi:hypothetical protein